MSRHSNVTDRLDTVFDLLSDSHRRYLLYHLVTVDEDVVEFGAAVDAVHEYETEQSGTAGATETGTAARSSRDEIETALRHKHLPRLADAEVLDYDPRRGLIRMTERRGLEEWVELARPEELE